jgi:Tol biopolymer transport system component
MSVLVLTLSRRSLLCAPVLVLSVVVLAGCGSGNGNSQRRSELVNSDGPRWTADGRAIMFVRGRCTDASCDPVVHQRFARMTMNGSRPRVLIGMRIPRAWDWFAWSRDGKRIAFTTFTRDVGEEVSVMNADGTKARKLIDGSEPAWSPDGSRIAFVHGGMPGSQIFVIRADGSRSHALTPPGQQTYVTTPVWSPHGREIAFTRATCIEGGCGTYAYQNIWVIGLMTNLVTNFVFRNCLQTGWFCGADQNGRRK